MSAHASPDANDPAEASGSPAAPHHGVGPDEDGDTPKERLLQSLQLHQLELAQQNESLEQARLDLAASLRDAERRYDDAPVGLVTVNRAGLVQRVNRRARAMLELPEETPLARAMLDRLERVSRDALWRAMSAPPAAASPPPTELVIVLASGQDRVLHAELAAHADGDSAKGGAADTFMMALVDVTERRRAELALDHTRHILALSNRVARIGHWSFECDSDRLRWSDVVREIHELPPGETPSLDDAVNFCAPGPHRERLRHALSDALARGEPFDLDLCITTRGGHERWVRLIGLAQWAGDRCLRLYGTVQDIDARIQAERARLALAQTQASMRNKSEFMARVSHDLRTPLNALIAFTQLLQRDEVVARSPTAPRQLQMMAAAGAHLLALIDDVLDFASIESGGLRLQVEAVPLAPLLRECVDLVATEGQARGVAVWLDEQAAQATHRVLADPRRLRQLLVNILGNGVKYNRPRGTVVLSLPAMPDAHAGGNVGGNGAGNVAGKGAEEGPEAAAATAAPDQVAIAVSDNGLGIAAEVLPLLFQPFTRGAAPGQQAVEGTGLGLAITRQLVDAMGGRLSVRSTLGQGSVFTVHLPLARPAHAEAGVDGTATPASSTINVAAAAAAAAAEAPAPYRVLCVEDNAVNAEVVRCALEGCGAMALRFAADGAAALRAVADDPPDLILMDLGLPDLSGLQVLARLKADAATAQIPCVAVSANAEPSTIRAAMAAGFLRYVLKPLAVDELLALVEQYRPAPARSGAAPPAGTPVERPP